MSIETEAILTWGVEYDILPIAEEERENYAGDGEHWLTDKLGQRYNETDIIYVPSGSALCGYDSYVLGVRTLTFINEDGGPKDLGKDSLSAAEIAKANEVFAQAWKKLRPDLEVPECRWYLVISIS